MMPLHAASVVLPSKHSPGPSPYIGWKWSKPQIPSKPSSSANRARARDSVQGMRCWAMSRPKRMCALYYHGRGRRQRVSTASVLSDRDVVVGEGRRLVRMPSATSSMSMRKACGSSICSAGDGDPVSSRPARRAIIHSSVRSMVKLRATATKRGNSGNVPRRLSIHCTASGVAAREELLEHPGRR